MEDFYYAGGLPAVIRELGAVLNKDALTVEWSHAVGQQPRRAALRPRRHQARDPAAR